MDTAHWAFFEGSEININPPIFILLIRQVSLKKDNLSLFLSLAFWVKMLLTIERYICKKNFRFQRDYREMVLR